MRRRRTPRAAAVALGAVALLASGCGIRGTSVPVDAGAAPSRASCQAPPEGRSAQFAGRVSVTVYLVCTSQIHALTRGVGMDEKISTEPVQVARAMLEQLHQSPTASENDAGFSTAVDDELEISGPGAHDPDGALRLNHPLDQVESRALAQLVCTLADTSAADSEHGVLLGGPEGSGSPLLRYECTAELRRHPELALAAGTAVS